MVNIDYERIVSLIGAPFLIYREDDFVYLLYPDPMKNGNILFQEMESCLIVWSNEYTAKPMLEVYRLIAEATDADLLFPYIESKEELQTVLSLGATPIDFVVEDDETLCKKYGSYYLKRA